MLRGDCDVLRAELWDKIDADTQRMIDDLIIETKSDLRSAGFPAKGSRFPFGMHHEFYRIRVRFDGRKALQCEVATMLNAWSATRPDRIDYARQAVCGAVKSMLAARPELAGRIPPSVRSAMTAVGDGYEFLSWVKTAVATSPDCFAFKEEVIDRDRMIDELIEAVSGSPGAGQSEEVR